jgi:Predicted flavin-nucleotide-binding protein
MRRCDREIPLNEALAVLDSAEYGVLSLVDPQGKPYAVPVSFVRDDGRLIFHCAAEGRKLDCIRYQPIVTFCVVGRTKILPEQFTTEYESVLIEGIAEIIENEQQKINDLLKLCEKYVPDDSDAIEKMIDQNLHRTVVVEIRMTSVTGKANR